VLDFTVADRPKWNVPPTPRKDPPWDNLLRVLRRFDFDEVKTTSCVDYPSFALDPNFVWA